MNGIHCQLIVCILVVLICLTLTQHNRQLSRKDRSHLDSYMWTLDKPTASLSTAV